MPGSESPTPPYPLSGEMSDASEVLYTLYEAINGVAGARSPVDAVFGLRIKEGVRCSDCGALTHQQVNWMFLDLKLGC